MDISFLTKHYSALLSDLERQSQSHGGRLFSRSCRSELLRLAATSDGVKVLAQSAKAFDSWLNDDMNLVSDLRGGSNGSYELIGRCLAFARPPNCSQTVGTSRSNFSGDISPQEVSSLRQAFRYLVKLEIPGTFSKDDTRSSIRRFIETDNECRTVDPDCELIRRARDNVSRFLGRTSPFDIVPKHGPGNVASKENYHQKWHFKRVDSLNLIYPFHEYFVASQSHLADWGGPWGTLCNVPQRSLMYNRYCEVPKDVTKNRGICLELPEVQFIQQGILRNLDRQFRRRFRPLKAESSVARPRPGSFDPITNGIVLMHDQTVNQELAYRGSIDGSYTTIDLKDASDLISNQLVFTLFPQSWHESLFATRSPCTVFPDGSSHWLKKYASMGSALCFPVECLVFWSISLAAIQMAARGDKLKDCPLSVYGDDIVVLSEYFGHVYDALKYCGLAVNWSKTFYSGGFRESCGADYYRGHGVTPVYLRKVATAESKNPAVFGSVLAHCRELESRGLFKTSETHMESIQSYYGEIQELYAKRGFNWDGILPGANFIGVTGVSTWGHTGSLPSRWNSRLQRWEFLVPTLRTRDLPSRVAGFDRLFQSLTLQGGDKPDSVILRDAAVLRLSWCSPNTRFDASN